MRQLYAGSIVSPIDRRRVHYLDSRCTFGGSDRATEFSNPTRRWHGRLLVPRPRPAPSSRSRQTLGDDRLRRGVDQVVEEGAIA